MAHGREIPPNAKQVSELFADGKFGNEKPWRLNIPLWRGNSRLARLARSHALTLASSPHFQASSTPTLQRDACTTSQTYFGISEKIVSAKVQREAEAGPRRRNAGMCCLIFSFPGVHIPWLLPHMIFDKVYAVFRTVHYFLRMPRASCQKFLEGSFQFCTLLPHTLPWNSQLPFARQYTRRR